MSGDIKLKMSVGPENTRLESLEKFLSRNDDATLVKLIGIADTSMKYKPGHLCRIEEDDDDDQKYNVFVGKHYIGELPDEAIAFAKQVDSIPECLVSIIGKVEDDGISIYIAE